MKTHVPAALCKARRGYRLSQATEEDNKVQMMVVRCYCPATHPLPLVATGLDLGSIVGWGALGARIAIGRLTHKLAVAKNFARSTWRSGEPEQDLLERMQEEGVKSAPAKPLPVERGFRW